MRTLIKNGLVVTAADELLADVLIEGEKIAALAANGSPAAESWAAGAERVLDATGLYVIPGGVDGHTHMQMPFGGTEAADTFGHGRFVERSTCQYLR